MGASTLSTSLTRDILPRPRMADGWFIAYFIEGHGTFGCKTCKAGPHAA